MGYTNYPRDRGSKWRKWDLHVHTPCSYLNDQFGDDFDEYVKRLFAKAVNEEIAVIGITDYFTIEGYKKIKQEYLENKEKLEELFENDNELIGKVKQILLLPNIEFRLNQQNKNSEFIQIHLLFSNKIEISRIESFLSRLPLISTDDLTQTRKYCTPGDLNSLGYDKALINYDNLLQCLKNDFVENEYLIVGVARGYGNIRPAPNDGRGAEYAKEIDKNSSFFFGNKDDVDFYLNRIVGRGQYNLPPKAVVLSSDAHCFEDMFNKYVWIKADPTFEGLRQIIYEPEDRVRIQKDNPDDDYPKHFFSKIKIKRTKIFENSEVAFDSIELPLNPNLVTIIGGRGAGKSLLLDAVAKTLKKVENNKRANFVSISNGDFSITFTKSDKTSKDLFIQGDNNIDYLHIHQGEVKKIVDPKDDALDEEIKQILNLPQQPEISYEKSFINRLIDEIFEIRDYLNEKDDKGNKIHTEEFINKQIKEKESLIKNITTKENQELIKKYINNVSEIKKINTNINILESLEDELKRIQEDKNAIISDINNKLSEEEKIPLISFDSQFKSMKKLKEKLNNDKENKNRENIRIIKEFRNKGIKGDITTLLEQTKQYQEQIENLKKQLDTVEKRKSELEQKFQTLSKIADEISEKYKEFKTTIKETWKNLKNGKEYWSEEQKKLLNELLKDIEIEVIEKFDANLFYEMIKDNIKLTKFKKTSEEAQMDRIRNFFRINSENDFIEFLKDNKPIGDEDKKLKDLLVSEIFVQGGEKEFFKNLFINYAKYWSVITIPKYKNKELYKLSVGMKGTMYLCLKLANDPFMKPFVFDQPEDDLDNDFIVKELVPLFKKIKKYRQVIIVTHNANLVVNADAEQIIVAKNNSELISYEAGGLENLQIREHVCEILEGGKDAFKKRENKYGFKV